MLRALMHVTSEMLITCAPMLAACTIARANVWTVSIFADVWGSSSPVYGSLRPKAWLDCRIAMMSTSGAIPLKASGPAAGVAGAGAGAREGEGGRGGARRGQARCVSPELLVSDAALH